VVRTVGHQLAAAILPLAVGRQLDAMASGRIALRLSMAFGTALHVMYDSRIGFRHAQVFRRGSPGNAYGSDTERWHILDASGHPDTSRTFSTGELDDSQEYQTAEDAVAQGLRAAGWDGDISTRELIQVLCHGAMG
jgi:hypothetical protein